MSDSKMENAQPGYSSPTRRTRLERIASAERDRRAGRREVAIATIGEPVEWPARAVLTLAMLSDADTASRRLLEEGLDLWARDAGLEALSPPSFDSEPDPLGFDLAEHPLESEMDSPVGLEELDRAFDEAEADVASMHNVNEVAERVLLDEPMGFEADEDERLTPVAEPDEYDVSDPDVLGMDAAYVAPIEEHQRAEYPTRETQATGTGGAQREIIVATLETWLRNLEIRKRDVRKQDSRMAGRA